MAKTRKKNRRAQTKYTIPTNWDVIEWPPFRLEGNWLVTVREAAPRVRSAAAEEPKRRLHLRLASAVEKRGGEVVLKEDWRQRALDFANNYFPPVADTSVTGGLRVSVARFGEEALLVWWTSQLGLELARGAEQGSLDSTLRAAVQVWGLRMPGRKGVPQSWLPGLSLSRITLDAERWIGLFASTLPKPRQRDDGLAEYVRQAHSVDRHPDAVASLPSADCRAIVEVLKTARGSVSAERTEKREARLKGRAHTYLLSLLKARYGQRSVRRDPPNPHRPLRQINAEIRNQLKPITVRPTLGVLSIGGEGDPEQELWDLAVRVFASTVNSRMSGAMVTCSVQPEYGEVARLTPGFRFITPLARIWFDYWKDLGGMVEVGTCEVCGDPFAARTCTQQFCCKRCRKTAEMRERRRRRAGTCRHAGAWSARVRSERTPSTRSPSCEL